MIRSDESSGLHVVLEVTEIVSSPRTISSACFVEKLADVVLSQRPARASNRRRRAAPSTAVSSRTCGSKPLTKVGEEHLRAVSFRCHREPRTADTDSDGDVDRRARGNRGGSLGARSRPADGTACSAPRYVTGDDVPKELVDKEREIIVGADGREESFPKPWPRWSRARREVRRRDHAHGPGCRQGRQEAGARRPRGEQGEGQGFCWFEVVKASRRSS